MKHRSFMMYILTLSAKTMRDSIWWVVLVGRYPLLNQISPQNSRTVRGRRGKKKLVGRSRGATQKFTPDFEQINIGLSQRDEVSSRPPEQILQQNLF